MPIIHNRPSKIIFIITILVCSFWITSHIINIYDFPFLGALFEIAWLPMLALIIILPVLTLIYWIIQKFRVNSYHLYAFIISSLTLYKLLTIFNLDK